MPTDRPGVTASVPDWRVGLIGSVLLAVGSAFVLAAMWSHRDWCGYVGLALWAPGLIVYARYFVAVRRFARARRGRPGSPA